MNFTSSPSLMLSPRSSNLAPHVGLGNICNITRVKSIRVVMRHGPWLGDEDPVIGSLLNERNVRRDPMKAIDDWPSP